MGGRPGLILIDTGDVDSRGTPHRAQHPVAVGIVDECGANATTADACHAILGVVHERVGRAAHRARGHVAHRVVAVAIAVGSGHGMGLAAAIAVAVTRIAGDVADAVVVISVVVLAGAHTAGRG